MKINDIGYCFDDALTLYQVKDMHSGLLILQDIRCAGNVRYVMPDQFWCLLNFTF